MEAITLLADCCLFGHFRRFYPLASTQLILFRSVVVAPCFIYCHLPTQNFWSTLSERGTHFEKNLGRCLLSPSTSLYDTFSEVTAEFWAFSILVFIRPRPNSIGQSQMVNLPGADSLQCLSSYCFVLTVFFPIKK